MRPQCLQIGGEHPVGAQQAFDAHRGGDVGECEQMVEVGDGEHELAQHAVGAVDQGQTLLLRQDDGGQAVLGERHGRIDELAVRRADRPFPGRRERDVRQWGEVAGAAETAVLVDHRCDSCGQQVGVGLCDFGAHPGAAGRERRQAQQHQCADDLPLHFGAGAGGM